MAKQTPKQEAIKEIQSELAMRRKVWERIPGKAEEFTSLTHQKRYNTMLAILATLEALPDRAFKSHLEIEDQQSQLSIF